MNVHSGKIRWLVCCLVVVMYLSYNGNDWLIIVENQSIHSKIVVNEKNQPTVQNAKRLPTNGINFQTYSRFLSTIGRTHVHEKVRNAVVKAYNLLEKHAPGVMYVYGETGWKNGGNFWPHRTHRNGLCVDFMVPVKSTTMFLWPGNAWGYHIRFDEKGIYKQYSIDLEAIVEHLSALQEACKLSSLKIKTVILDLPLVALLKKTDIHQKLKEIPFAAYKAWFPHDSHYHVEFEER
jgi:penicillin-insensitive murein endopeptidase